MANAWDRQPDEPMRWYERFELYRLAGPNRSIDLAFQASLGMQMDANGSKGKRPNRNWYDMALRWSWRERAEAWDLGEVDRRKVEAEAKAQRDREEAAAKAKRDREEYELERIEDKVFRRRFIKGLRGKITDLLNNGDGSPLTLLRAAQAARIVLEQLRIEYDDVPAEKVEIETGAPGAFVNTRPKMVFVNVPTTPPSADEEPPHGPAEALES